MNYLPQARLTCIDTFAGGQEHREHEYTAQNDLPVIEARFDANTAAFASRIEKIKARSHDGLAQLGVAGRRFDIAYIDGSHTAADVYADAMLTWPLMAPGGLVMFDDYEWDEMPEPLDNPKPGVDALPANHRGPIPGGAAGLSDRDRQVVGGRRAPQSRRGFLLLRCVPASIIFAASRLQRPLPRLRGRDREGALSAFDQRSCPLPNPPPQAGEGARRACGKRPVPFALLANRGCPS